MSKKHVSILGLGISGFESARFLKDKGYEIYVSDSRENDDTTRFAEELKKKGIDAELGRHDEKKIFDSEWVLISPGISPFSSLVVKITERRIPILSDIEVASWFCHSKKIIAVTGTAGKTTMASLIASLLKRRFPDTLLCGNIGNPWIGELTRIQNQPVVLEVSSFQLFYCEKFRPWIAILMNLSPNHFDWHRTMAHYIKSKLKIFSRQTSSDHAFIREEDRRRYFPTEVLKGKVFCFEDLHSPHRQILTEIARINGMDPALAEAAIGEFQGIEHRLEKCGDYHGIQFVNDSKCTTPLSLRWALQRYEDQKVILLAGGRAKSDNFQEIEELVSAKARKLILYGEAASMIAQSWRNHPFIAMANSLEEAVEMACRDAEEGDAVLLSPACASFDMFKNYQARGMAFKNKVSEILKRDPQLR